MRRSLRPEVDPLEDRALLSAAHVAHIAQAAHHALVHHALAHHALAHHAHHNVHHPAHHAPAKPPVVVTPPAPIVPPIAPTPVSPPPATATEIATTITTDKTSYKAGDSVTMTLKQTNISDHAVTMTWGPSGNAFIVSKAGATVWQSNDGIQPQYVLVYTLQPGESRTFSAVWNDEPRSANPFTPITGNPVTGTLQVSTNYGGAPLTITVA